MKIEYLKGDLLDSPESCIIHGCNAQGVMGRGIALAIKQRLPFAYEAYRHAFESPRGLVMGQIVWAINTGNQNGVRSRIVGNAITQAHYDAAHQVNGMNVDYDAVQICIRTIDRFVMQTSTDEDLDEFGKLTRVGFPKIGAGLGGGDWEVISKIIEDESHNFRPIVYLKD